MTVRHPNLSANEFKYLVVVDDDVDMHNTSEVHFRVCANTDPQRVSIFTKGPSDQGFSPVARHPARACP